MAEIKTTEVKLITFDHKEVVEALIKHQDLHEGIWQLYVEFGIAAANIGMGEKQQISPSAIVPIQKIGLIRAENEGPLSLNASEVNPE